MNAGACFMLAAAQSFAINSDMAKRSGWNQPAQCTLQITRELCLILGDGVDQAADFTSCTTSIPSLNFTPLMTFGN